MEDVLCGHTANIKIVSKNLQPTVKYRGGSVMVQDYISARGVGNLHFINGIMKHDVYLNI